MLFISLLIAIEVLFGRIYQAKINPPGTHRFNQCLLSFLKFFAMQGMG